MVERYLSLYRSALTDPGPPPSRDAAHP
jgi:hypothetical protein